MLHMAINLIHTLITLLLEMSDRLSMNPILTLALEHCVLATDAKLVFYNTLVQTVLYALVIAQPARPL